MEHDASSDVPDEHEDSSGSLGCLAQALIALGLSALIVLVFVVISGLAEQRGRDSVFSESVSSASVSLGDPDSPSERLDWHEGSSALGGGCVLQRRAWWLLDGRSPDLALEAIRATARSDSGTAFVEPLPNERRADQEMFSSGFYGLEGSPLSYYSVRLIAGSSTDDVFHIVVFGETC
jgi:hypothetical protein